MGKLDDNGLLYFWQRIKNIFATKAELKDITDSMGELGYGDMMKAAYDTNNDGKVDSADNADKLGGQSPEYYAKKSELFSGSYKDLTDTPDDFAPTDHNHEMSDITGLTDTIQQYVDEVDDRIGTMAEIAQGKCKSYTFATVEELDTWLTSEENIAGLNTGDVFLIRAIDVPDYWWDGTTNTKQILETTKVDLTPISNAEIDAILAT